MSETADALDLLAGLLLEDGRSWGAAATPEQWSDARAVLDLEAPRRRHWIGRARGYSKTSDVAAFVLIAMLTQLKPGQIAYAAAADRDQARLLLDSLRGYVSRDEALRGLVDVQQYRVLIPSRDVVLQVLAADSSGAYGLRPALLVLDELCQWPKTASAQEFYAALTSALPKVPGSRSVVITTAGDPAHWSKKVFDAATSSPLWRVSELHGPPPWMDPDEIEEQRNRLYPSEFARLFLNEWATSEDRLVTPADLEACITLSGDLQPQPGVRYVAGLDVGTSNDATVIVVAHAERTRNEAGKPESTRVVVDHVRSWVGTRAANVDLDDVEKHLRALAARYPKLRVMYDPSQAIGMAQRLGAYGLTMERFDFTAASVGRIASSIYNLIRTRSLALPRHPELVDELLHVRLRPNAYGVMRVDHDAGRHDDHVIALGLATLDLQVRVSAATNFLVALAANPLPALDLREVDRPGMSPIVAAVAGIRREFR